MEAMIGIYTQINTHTHTHIVFKIKFAVETVMHRAFLDVQTLGNLLSTPLVYVPVVSPQSC